MTHRSPQAVSPKRGMVCGLFVYFQIYIFDDHFTVDFYPATINIEA